MLARLSVALGALVLLAGQPAQAQRQIAPDIPVLITADEVGYDQQRGIVTAHGHVEISQQDRVLQADEVTYNQNTKVVIATGNVSLTEPSGDVFFADRVEVTDDLKDGVITNFRMLFPDETRLAANDAQRSSGTHTEMNRVVFSPCATCQEEPDEPLIWQIKARKVVHDQETRDIEYFDATLEMFDIPVAYTPYLSHPDPTVKRRSGFLIPTYGSDSQLGILVKTPYFLTLGPDKDLTLEPIFTSKERAALAAQYRQRIENGAFEVAGSYTRVKRRDDTGAETGGGQNRGHIMANGLFDIDRTWRWGFDGGWTTDDTYMRRYSISSTDVITSTAFLEGFRGRNYAAVEGFHFQGLREDDNDETTPIVAPFASYNVISTPFDGWGRWNLDANMMVLTRPVGVSSRRLSLRGGWQLPIIRPAGDITTFSVGLAGDMYWVNGVPQRSASNAGRSFSGVTGRIYPHAMVDWRYPFVREFGNVRQLLEPRVAVIAAPNGQNPGSIPNEDSVDFEFDDTNLFSANRFPGVDRVSGGQWLVYGASTAFYGDKGGKTSMFLGQTFRLSTDDTFGDASGLENRISDVVGRVNIEPADYLQVGYRFRLDQENFKPRRNEVTAVIGPKELTFSVNYLFFASTGNNTEFPDREEVFAAARAEITDRWSISARTRRDLSDTGGVLSYGFGVAYICDCFQMSVDFSRTFTRDRDVKPSNRIFVQLVFKHLGEIGGALN